MGKGKKKSGGGAAAAPAGPAIASDETLASETLDAIEARHELELAEVKKVTAGMTGKKDAMQVLHIEGEVTDRHYLEMRRWEELHEEEEDGSDASNEDLATSLKATSLAETETNTEKPSSPSSPGGATLTKAMKRRMKKEQEEREREERVARETAAARAAGTTRGESENKKLEAVLGARGLRVKEIKADGHCLYRAILDQLLCRIPMHDMSARLAANRDGDKKEKEKGASIEGVSTLRRLAARVMRDDPDAYRPFLETDSRDEDPDSVWSTYLSDVESTAAWGGQLELQALATGLRVPIEVFTANAPSVTMGESFVGENGGAALRVCHHRHAFGLGEHYNSAADA